LPVSGSFKLTHALTLDGLFAETAPPQASFKILARLPDGSLLPLVWLQNYDARYRHAFLLRKPLSLPPFTVIEGVPQDARVMLLPVRR
jgi:hypothetical protein